MTDAFMSNAHASVPEVTKPITGSSSGAATSSAKLELVRSGAASIEEELQQRASILAVDNANLRTMLDQTNSELHSLRAKMNEFDTMQQKLVKMHLGAPPPPPPPPPPGHHYYFNNEAKIAVRNHHHVPFAQR